MIAGQAEHRDIKLAEMPGQAVIGSDRAVVRQIASRQNRINTSMVTPGEIKNRSKTLIIVVTANHGTIIGNQVSITDL
jgi:hypothetical protein